MIFMNLYLQVKEAIQSNNGYLSAAETECARIVAEAEEAGEERFKENQQGSAGGKGKGKVKHPEDDFMATLHQQLDWPAGPPTAAGDAATDSGGGIRGICQGHTCQLDTTEIQEGAHRHQPDRGSCHAG